MSLAALLLLSDGRLPAGGHAHSGGAETACARRLVHDAATLQTFLEGRLATVGRVAAGVAATACAAVLDAPGPGRGSGLRDRAGPPGGAWSRSGAWSRRGPCTPAGLAAALDRLGAELDARTPSPAARAASRSQGRALVRLAGSSWPSPVYAGLRQPHHSVVLGVVAAVAGCGPREAATAAALAAVSGPASAVVRLLGLDPYVATAVQVALAPEVDRIAGQAVGEQARGGLAAGGAPALDVFAEQHAAQTVRLFAG